MTYTRYLISRVARAFGVHRRNQRMGDAASETHLLREAEAHLGAVVWEKVENIEKLSSDYWNLRKLSQESTLISAKLKECQEKLEKAHEERANLLNTASDPELKLNEEKAKVVASLNELAIRRDEIIISAKEIRRAYEGLKVKSEVLAGEKNEVKPSASEITKINTDLADLKQKFAALKLERNAIAADIEKGDARIGVINEKIAKIKKGQYDRASKAFQIIGDANKEISAYRAEFGVIETRMTQLYAEIGRYVSRSASEDPSCAEAARGQQGLIEVMRALRKSITLNHKLAEN